MKAGYILQGNHILEADNPALKPFDIFVCNASLKGQSMERAAPHALFFPSFNATMIPSYGLNNPFFISLRLEMEQYYLRYNGVPVIESSFRDTFIDWRILEGATVYANWILNHLPNTENVGGVYIDDGTATIPEHKLQDLPDRSVADAYPTWFAKFISILGDFTPLIVNRGNGNPLRNVHGICYERSHKDRMGALGTLARYVIQSNLGGKPVYNIDWTGSWEMPLFGIYRGSSI